MINNINDGHYKNKTTVKKNKKWITILLYFPEKNEILNFYTALEFEEILNTLSKTLKKNIALNYTNTYFVINKYNDVKLNKHSKLNKTKYNKPNIIYSNFS